MRQSHSQRPAHSSAMKTPHQTQHECHPIIHKLWLRTTCPDDDALVDEILFVLDRPKDPHFPQARKKLRRINRLKSPRVGSELHMAIQSSGRRPVELNLPAD